MSALEQARENVERCREYAVEVLGDGVDGALDLMLRCPLAGAARAPLDDVALALERKRRGPALRAIDLYQSACKRLQGLEIIELAEARAEARLRPVGGAR